MTGSTTDDVDKRIMISTRNCDKQGIAISATDDGKYNELRG